MFVEVIPNVFVRADCVYRISINGNIVAVMFNDGTGGNSQTVSWTFSNAEAAKTWAHEVGTGVAEVLRPRPTFIPPQAFTSDLMPCKGEQQPPSPATPTESYPERHQKRKQ